MTIDGWPERATPSARNFRTRTHNSRIRTLVGFIAALFLLFAGVIGVNSAPQAYATTTAETSLDVVDTSSNTVDEADSSIGLGDESVVESADSTEPVSADTMATPPVDPLATTPTESSELSVSDTVELDGDAISEEDDSDADETPIEALQAADGRQEFFCSNPPDDLTCSEEKIFELIAEAGTTPTRIYWGAVDTMMTKTIRISAGQDIEFVNHPRAPWGATDSGIVREDGFTGTMIHIDTGGKLTISNNPDGGEIEVRARGQWVTTRAATIQVNGELIMNGGEVSGARGISGTNRGAITVTGPDSSFTLNDGSVTDNRMAPSAQGGAGNIAVSSGGEVVINGGTVSKGWSHPANAYGTAGGIGVMRGGSLEVNGGEITDNEGFAGGIIVTSHYIYSDRAFAEQHKDDYRNYVTINGGSITGNVAGFYGGGIAVWDNSVVTMNAGTISGNVAPNGGGVGTMDLYVWGADASWQAVAGPGQESGLTLDEWSNLVPAAFTMNGGEITGNSTSRTGGGINVISEQVHLLGGLISGNSASQGGGVYVATQPYELKLNNVLVTQNASSYIGGGIWVCPTGELDLHVTSGGAILDNTAATYGDDFAHDNLGTVGALDLWLAERMLGGASVQYFWDNGNDRFDPANPGEPQVFKDRPLFQQGLKTVPQEPIVPAPEKVAVLTITGNTAQRGAGIGSNGGVVIGEPDIDIDVDKLWLTSNGDALTEGLPEAIELQLVSVADDGSTANIDPPVRVTSETDWKHTFRDLPAYGSYSVIEAPIEGFDSNVSMTKTDAGYALTVENTATTVDVFVEKSWLDEEGNPAAESDIPDSIEVQLVTVDTDGDTSNVGDPIVLSPGNNWSHTFTDLPRQSQGEALAYSVVETPVPGYQGAVSVTQTDDGYTLALVNSKSTVDVVVDKSWLGADGQTLVDGLPEAIELQLVTVANDGTTTNVGAPVQVTAAGGWTYTFTDLPEYSGGEIVAYSVVETPIEGFESKVSSAKADGGYALTVENTKVPEPTEPSDPPTEPSDPPTEPSDPPTEPMEPSDPPVEPTEPPTPAETSDPPSPTDPPSIPRTGAQTLTWMLSAGLLLLMGLVLVVRRQRYA